MRARGLAYSAERHPGLVAELSLTGLASNTAQERLMATIGLVPDRSAGFDEGSLDVDSDNPKGALGVYHRAGFEVESRWTKQVPVVTP